MHYTLGRFCLTESGLFQPGMILHIDIFRFFQHILCPSDLDMRATRQYDGVYAAIFGGEAALLAVVVWRVCLNRGAFGRLIY